MAPPVGGGGRPPFLGGMALARSGGIWVFVRVQVDGLSPCWLRLFPIACSDSGGRGERGREMLEGDGFPD